MKIRLLAFASLAHRLGFRERLVELADHATVGDIVAMLRQERPDLTEMLDRAALAVNFAYVKADHPLGADDELALIPPVSGG